MSTDGNQSSPVQLGLGIEPSGETPAREDNVTSSESHEDQNRHSFGLHLTSSGTLIVAGFFLIVTAFLMSPSENRQRSETSIPENFLVEDLTPARPMTRNFPEFEFPNEGEVLQLGLFARLEGAESHQTELTGLGLAPHIEKRVTNNSVQYAVVLGPLDPEDHQNAVKTLQDNELQFFHRQRRDS